MNTDLCFVFRKKIEENKSSRSRRSWSLLFRLPTLAIYRKCLTVKVVASCLRNKLSYMLTVTCPLLIGNEIARGKYVSSLQAGAFNSSQNVTQLNRGPVQPASYAKLKKESVELNSPAPAQFSSAQLLSSFSSDHSRLYRLALSPVRIVSEDAAQAYSAASAGTSHRSISAPTRLCNASCHLHSLLPRPRAERRGGA